MVNHFSHTREQARSPQLTPFNKNFRHQDQSYHKFLVEPGIRVLSLGCGNGDLLAAVKPSYGVGIDFTSEIVNGAKSLYPEFAFHVDGCEGAFSCLKTQLFDAILITDYVGLFKDIQGTLEGLKRFCHPGTRIVIAYYTKQWELPLKLSEIIGLKKPQPTHNYLSTADIESIARLSGFESIRKEYQQLVPFSWFGIGKVINKMVGTLPGIRRLCFRTYTVLRANPEPEKTKLSVSIIIPCRNEKGNIEAAIERIPLFAPEMEIIFVEGHSQDGTWEEVQRVQKAYPHRNIKIFQQKGKGKADAVHLGFSQASHDVLMILDADLTVKPEDLPKFYKVIEMNQGDFVNGTRLIYPMEGEAMRFLNFLANKTFSWIFSYLLSQRLTDTLCGTKVFRSKDYLRIKKQRDFFGDFDPFGDFELIFGASKLNLKIVEVPIRYQARSYGSTQISRFRHGFILLRMVLHAYKKLKFFPS